jgi:hypothetical protein
MKNLNIGLAFLFFSVIIYGSVLLSAANYSKVLVQPGQSWDNRYGIFGTALREIGTLPITLSILFGIAGVFFIVLSIKKG